MSSCIQNVMETSPKVKKGLAELWYLIEDFIFFVNFANQGRFPPKTEKNEARLAICLYLRCNEAGRKEKRITFTQAGVYIFKIFIRISFL